MKELALIAFIFGLNALAYAENCPNAKEELAKDEERIEQTRSSFNEQWDQLIEFELENSQVIEIYQSHLDHSQLDANTRPKYQKFVDEAKESLIEIARLKDSILEAKEDLTEYEVKAMKAYLDNCSNETRINFHSSAAEETRKLAEKVRKLSKLRNLCRQIGKGFVAIDICLTNVSLEYMNMSKSHILNCSLLSKDRYETCLNYGGRIDFNDINQCNEKFWDKSFNRCIQNRASNR